jgi:hypothetical protein
MSEKVAPEDQVCSPEQDNPDVDAQLQGTPAAKAPAARAALSPERALLSAQNAVNMTKVIRETLKPAYRNAVDAINPVAALELGTHIFSAYSAIETARTDIAHAFPPDNEGAAMVSTPDSAVDDTVEAAHARWLELQGLQGMLIGDESVLGWELIREVGPGMFRGVPVAEGAVAPPPKKNAAARIANEAGTVVEILALIHKIREVTGASAGECRQLSEAELAEIASWLEPYKSRPIDFAFAAQVLAAEDLWEIVAGAKGASGRSLAETRDKAQAQAAETGAFVDVGEFDADTVQQLLDDASDGNAMQVFETLKAMPPSARGPVIKQIDRMGMLSSLCEHLPWQYVKALHDVVAESGDHAAGARLRPYFEDKGGGKSLHKIYEENIMENLDEGGFINNAQAFGWTFLDTAHNALTFGFLHEYSAAYDASEEGWITDDQFYESAGKALGKAVAIGVVSTITGGLAGAAAEGAALGVGISEGAASIIGGGVGGAVGGVAGHFTGDVYDQLLNGKEGFDSLGDYGMSAAVGGASGAALATVSVMAGQYLPASQQRMADLYATRYPRMTRVLEDVRMGGYRAGAAGRAGVVQVKMKVQEYLDSIDMGGFGGPTAFATANGADIRMMPPDQEISVRVRVPKDFNRPVMMSSTEEGGQGGGIGSKEGTTKPKAEGAEGARETPPLEVEEVDALLSPEEVGGNVRGRADGERSGKFEVNFTDEEIAKIVAEGRRLGLTEKEIEDLMFVASRVEKRISSEELIQQMTNYATVVKERGYPYRFESQEQFNAFKADLIAELQKFGLETGDVRIQGSSLRKPDAKDVDVAVLVDRETFQQMLEKRFGGNKPMKRDGFGDRANWDELAGKIGADSAKWKETVAEAKAELGHTADAELTPAQDADVQKLAKDKYKRIYNSEADTFARAHESGKIRGSDITDASGRKLSRLQEELSKKWGDVDVSVMSKDGSFDLDPNWKVE